MLQLSLLLWGWTMFVGNFSTSWQHDCLCVLLWGVLKRPLISLRVFLSRFLCRLLDIAVAVVKTFFVDSIDYRRFTRIRHHKLQCLILQICRHKNRGNTKLGPSNHMKNWFIVQLKTPVHSRIISVPCTWKKIQLWQVLISLPSFTNVPINRSLDVQIFRIWNIWFYDPLRSITCY